MLHANSLMPVSGFSSIVAPGNYAIKIVDEGLSVLEMILFGSVKVSDIPLG